MYIIPIQIYMHKFQLKKKKKKKKYNNDNVGVQKRFYGKTIGEHI